MHKLNRAELEAIVRSIPAGVVVLEKKDGRVSYVNDRAVELCGVDPCGLEMPSHSTKLMKLLTLNGQVYPPEKLPTSIALLNGEEAKNELIVERPDGSRVIVSASAKPIVDEDGEVVGAVGIFENITERKKAVEAIRESEQLYRTLFDKSDDGFILLEPLYDQSGGVYDFRFLKVNRAYERQTGAGPATIEGKRVSEDAGELVSLIGRVAKIGEWARFERFDWHTGRWYDSHIFPFAKGQVGALFRDITERKKAEEILDKKQKELNNILDSSPTIIFYKDKEGKFVQANKAFAEAFEKTKENLLGKTVFDLFSADIAQGMANDDFEVMTSKRTKLGIIERYESPSGWRWLRTDKIPSFDENGVVTGLIGFSEDITDRKKTEEALEDHTKKIIESDQSYRELYESFGEAFVATDWELNVIHWNKVAERLTKVKVQDALGKKVNDVMPETMMVDIKHYYEVLQKGEAVHFMLNTLSRETGNPAIFEISAYPSAKGIIYIVRDKTEQENNKRLSTIGQTAGMVGHDIRNPLQAMTGDVYLAKSDLDSLPESTAKESIRESLNSIQKNLDYVNKIVADLQDYARVLTPTIRETDVELLFADVLAKNVIPENIEVSRVVEAGANKLFTDPDMLKRILVNLVNNAVQAMPKGGKLSMHTFCEGPALVISVQDTGVGIPDEIKPKLFTPLFTTRSKGQGFGLAVIKRMTEALGGTVTFESQIGKGTKFTMRFPLPQA